MLNALILVDNSFDQLLGFLHLRLLRNSHASLETISRFSFAALDRIRVLASQSV